MRRDDQLYVARSAIQKAVRRGDLDLLKTSFDLLWGVKEHQQWLRWRIYTLVTEEAWHFAGELHKLLRDSDKSERRLRQFLYGLCLAKKNKDAVGLWWICHYYPQMLTDEMKADPEIDMTSKFVAMVAEDPENGKLISAAAEVAVKWGLGQVDSQYEKDAINLLGARARMGGMTGDRWICISSIVLVACRGLNGEGIQEELPKGVGRWFERIGESRKPKTLPELPWFTVDMHTQAGKIALRIFLKHHADEFGLDFEQFEALWFWCESGRMLGSLLDIVPIDTPKPTMLQNKFYATAVEGVHKFTIKQTGKSLDDLILWRDHIRPQVKGCVEWILKKREEK